MGHWDKLSGSNSESISKARPNYNEMKSLGPTLSCLSRELVLLLSGPIRELVLLLSGLNRELYCFTNKTLAQKTFKEQISTLQFTYKVKKSYKFTTNNHYKI